MEKEEHQTVPVTLMNSDGSSKSGMARVIITPSKKAFWKGAVRAARLLGIVMLVALPFGFLEPFLFMIWGSGLFILLVFIIGPILHLHFASETHSFTCVEAECPYCQSGGGLKPYLSTRFEDEFTVICSSCGQTTRVKQIR
jgi:hypothetical protein